MKSDKLLPNKIQMLNLPHYVVSLDVWCKIIQKGGTENASSTK